MHRFLSGGVITTALFLGTETTAHAQGESTQTPGEVRQELDELRRELDELRAWREAVEAGAARGAGVSRDEESVDESGMDRAAGGSAETGAEDGAADGSENGPPLFRLPKSWSLGVSGQVRVRPEYRGNVYAPPNPDGEESFDFVGMRTRLRFDLEADEQVEVRVELQDVRAWGDEGDTLADTEGLDLNRGYFRVKDIGGHDWRVDAGRFVMAYGDLRIIGNAEWGNVGRSFDGVRSRYRRPGSFWADVFATRIRDDVAGIEDVQDFVGVYAGTESWVDGLDAEAYALWLRDGERRAGEEESGRSSFVTLGSRWFGEGAGLDYTGEFAMQTGELRDDDLTAWAVAVDGGYTFEGTSGAPRVSLEVAWASGDDDSADGDAGTFQTLFPNGHLHLGDADVVAFSNIFQVRAGAQASPAENVTVAVDYHWFRLDDAEGGWFAPQGMAVIRPGAEGASEDLGEEIDLRVRWQATDALALEAGWAHFFPGQFVRDTGEDPGADFAYLQADVRF